MRIKSGDNVLLSGSIGGLESKTLNGGATVVNFGIRTENYKDDNGDWQSKWDNVQCFGNVAEEAQKLQKGDTVFAAGKLKSRQYKNKDGEDKTVVDIILDFLIKASAGSQAADQSANQSSSQSDGFNEAENDGDLPF